jgi:predicted DCC family thiol-disulfide oxidoreductase YuxK
VVEKLRCNVCNREVELAEAKDHAATKQHATLKSKLEHDLSVTKQKDYAHDVSVVLQWSKSAG